MSDIIDVLGDVHHEVIRAEAKHRPMRSAHEGYAVILEEVRELEREVFKGGSEPRDPDAMRKEAIEVAAMAVRFVRDLYGAVCRSCLKGTPYEHAGRW